ncbi:MAG: hypothetical protein LAO22_09990 [Acidobacteriia bacterium]|nr:hypothetical protein [Terriglobia bacterium]
MCTVRARISLLLCVAWVLFASQCATAQLVATKDLTDTASVPTAPPTSAELPSTIGTPDNPEKQDCFFEVANGVIVRDVPEKLRLEIVGVDPRLVYDGTAMMITVRVKNIGDLPVLVPWQTNQVEPDTDPKSGDTSYESATIHLTFGTLEDRKHCTYLKGEATLAAAPSNRAQHLELLSGQWADVKFKAAIQCASKETWACKRFHADEHAQLTAHWWEWLFTREEKGCGGMRGAYKSRTLESSPLEVVYVASPPSDEKKAAPPQ